MSSNDLYDDYHKYVSIPTREDVATTKGEDEYLNMINSLEEPRDRLITLFRSLLDPTSEPTHEAYFIRLYGLMGALSGLVIGGLMNSKGVHQQYQRRHNASVFEGKYVANRHFWDTLIPGVAARGLKTGLQVSLLTTSASTVVFGSIAYRNKLYLPDFIVGFGTIGALSRLWLGSKAMAIGSGAGLCVGLIAYGMVRTTEMVTQYSVTQMRLINHKDWLLRREAKLRKFQVLSEKAFIEQFKSDDRT